VTGTDLNVSSAMGLILLVGLVVKNGIVLLDFAEMRHQEGLPCPKPFWRRRACDCAQF
jgi:multidrug efflux pump subunit AcrB